MVSLRYSHSFLFKFVSLVQPRKLPQTPPRKIAPLMLLARGPLLHSLPLYSCSWAYTERVGNAGGMSWESFEANSESLLSLTPSAASRPRDPELPTLPVDAWL